MNAVRGRVRGGHIEIDAALPEGAEVVVFTAGGEEPFDLDDLHLSELETRMAVVALVPTLGAPARSERAPGVRRVLLRKTRYFSCATRIGVRGSKKNPHPSAS